MTRTAGRRIAVSGPPTEVASVLAALEPTVGTLIEPPPPTASTRGGPWPAIENALRRFEYRTDHESRHRTFASSGSVLQDWAELDQNLRSGDRRGRDITFADRYAAMFATTVARHARVTYSLHIVVASPGGATFDDDVLLSAIRAAGLPLIAAADAMSVRDIVGADRMLHADREPA